MYLYDSLEEAVTCIAKIANCDYAYVMDWIKENANSAYPAMRLASLIDFYVTAAFPIDTAFEFATTFYLNNHETEVS